MGWTDRQRAMLEEMGIRLWVPATAPPRAASAPGVGAPRPAAVAVPMSDRAAVPSAPTPARLTLDSDRASDRVSDLASEFAALDVGALAVRAAVCTACPLCAGRSRSVFGSGNPQADWMVVGDAPDADDDAAGEPFAGRAGQLLDNMLAAMRLSRGDAPRARQAYVTPSVKCRPPAGRAPEPREVERCRPYLARQVGLVQPRLIIAMGRVAAQSLLGTAEPITRLRGRVHRFEGVPVIVTYPPAHLLRHPQDKAGAWEDLCLALEVARDADAAQTDSR